MREHEFAVLLYALGSLDVDWAQVPTYVTNKIEHRVSRVATFLTPRSTSNALYGSASFIVYYCSGKSNKQH